MRPRRNPWRWAGVALLAGSLVANGCTTVASPSPSPRATPTPVPAPSDLGELGLCQPDRVSLVAGQSGGAAGTNYVTLTARLVGDAGCAIHAWPAVRITDASGSVVGTASPADPVAASRLVDLGPSLDYNLGWASWCGAPPVGPFQASVALVSSNEPSAVELPQGYGPSGCMGAPSTVTLEPAFEP